MQPISNGLVVKMEFRTTFEWQPSVNYSADNDRASLNNKRHAPGFVGSTGKGTTFL